MEWYTVAGGIVVLLLVLITIGLPIPFALTVASLPFLWGIMDWNASLASLQLILWGTWVNYTLLAVPLFVFLAQLVGKSQIGPRLYNVMHRGIPIRGSAAYGSVAANTAFGSICGTSMVGALTIGGVALPQMLALRYGKRLSAGSLAAGGTLSVLIPPSLILLFYGIVTDTSVGKLFIAGAIPGIILASLFVVVIVVWGVVRPNDFPHAGHRGLRSREVLIAILPVAILGPLVTVAIYAGIATPTEAAAVASVAALLLAFGVGRLNLKTLLEALVGTMRTMGYLGMLFAGAMLFAFVLNVYRVPQELSGAFADLGLGPILTLVCVLTFFIVVGMFLEPTAITFITVPIIFPLLSASGYDAIWFGVIFTITMEIAVLTPPVGLNLYVIQSMAPNDLTVSDVFYGCLPFVGVMCVLVALLIAFPQVAMWLPSTM